MSDQPKLSPASLEAARPSLLIVATVSGTIVRFLTPYATHFRAHGWRVDAAANGASTDPALVGAFDHLYELSLSRSVLDVRALLRGMRAMSDALESRPDIVHVHTPIAAFIARAAIRRLPAGRRPLVAYTAHGFHFHRAGSRVTNAVFLTAERIAGRWTDRLVVMNDEDLAAARRHRIVPIRRLVLCEAGARRRRNRPCARDDRSSVGRAAIYCRRRAEPAEADGGRYHGSGPHAPPRIKAGHSRRWPRTCKA